MIIGLERELSLMVHALGKGIPVILEGEAGTGKTEMAKETAQLLKRHLYRVDGDQELSSLKIQGWFDPPMVLSKGYGWDSFLPGPLSQAMLNGGIFFFNEVNRAPSETINAVLTALDERMLTIPRLGALEAEEGFGCVFTCNPLDRVGTNPLPQAFFDRCVWIRLDHLPLDQAVEVVSLRTHEQDRELIRLMCRITEGSRKHPDVVKGGALRAAIFMVKLASALRQNGEDPRAEQTLKELARSALTKKIKLRYNSELTEEQVVDEVVDRVLGVSAEKKKIAR